MINKNKYEILFSIITLLVTLFLAVVCVDFVVGNLQSSGLIEALTSHRTIYSGIQ